MERMSAQFVQLVVSIVLARILSPSDFGIVAMVTIFITFANVLIDGGFSSALVQKKDADDIDFSTVFYFSLVFSILLYAVLYFLAPSISAFYGTKYRVLTPILRVLGLQVIILAVNSVQQAYVQRQMMFKNFFWATIIGTITSALVGLFMAYSGYGIWSIVGQQLTASVINTLTLYKVTQKLPIFAFSLERLRNLFNYGVKLLGTSLLVIGFQELRALLIGKLYTAQDLAFFDRGRQIPHLIVTNINSSIGAVLFPKMAKEQDSIEQIKNTTRISIRFSAYLMCPIMCGLALVSEPFVRIVLTEKWIDCVPLMQWFCIAYLFMPIHTANMQALKAIGRSDTCFKLELVKKIIELASLFMVVWISVDAIVINMAILATLFTAVNAYPNYKLLNYSYKEQIADILPAITISMIMLIVILVFNYFVVLKDWVLLSIDIFIGLLLYLGLSVLTNNQEFKYIVNRIIKRNGE